MSNLQTKISTLPRGPGVYLFQDQASRVIYIGKGRDLKKRVSTYFQKESGLGFPKLVMVSEIKNIKYLTTSSEIEALLLEAKLIKKYWPRFNIKLRDDKDFLYLGITKEKWPRLLLIRRPKEDEYLELFGPFTSTKALKRVLRLIKNTFPYRTKKKGERKPCLQYYMHHCTEPCLHLELKGKEAQRINQEYKKIIKKIIIFLKGNFKGLEKKIKKEMTQASFEHQFEKAALLRDQLKALSNLKAHLFFEEDFSQGTRKPFRVMNQLQKILKLKKIPHRIEAYDISDIKGKEAVGSMAVFKDGQPDKSQYRKFRIKTTRGANDPAMMAEVVKRRLGHFREGSPPYFPWDSSSGLLMAVKGQTHLVPEEVSGTSHMEEIWPLPDLIVLDGGKPQLNIVLKTIKERGNSVINIIALAKRLEEIYLPGKSRPVRLPSNSLALHLLQQIRDEAHRFSHGYFEKRHRETVFKSILDEIPTLGPKRKKKLLQKFGSLERIKRTSLRELEEVVGKKIAMRVREYL